MNTKNISAHIHKEDIQARERFEAFHIPQRSFFEGALNEALNRIKSNLSDFTYEFPDVNSVDLVYPASDNIKWTPGFWTGMVWLAYEMTGEDCFMEVGNEHVKSFTNRFNTKSGIDTHDLGFLYSLSCVASYKLTGDESARDIGLRAAEHLFGRYNDASGMIRSNEWVGESENSIRIIIDCMLNLPLLYWAHEITGEKKYLYAAKNNAVQTANHLVRDDGSSYQVCHMDSVTGELIGQATHQGFNDTSTWSRGQAWGIYGFPLSYKYTGEAAFLDIAKAMTNYYLNRLPDDDIAAWDLIFTDNDAQRDTSAASAAACGMLELAKYLPVTDLDRTIYEKAAVKILTKLAESYTTADVPESNGLLKHGVYGMKQKEGIDECTLFGDYYYLEGLTRLLKDSVSYW